MLPPPHTVNWTEVGQQAYDWWTVIAGFTVFIGYVFRSRIGRGWCRFANALRSARVQSMKIDSLSSKLAEAESKADDWQERFTEMEQRYEALRAEFDRLRDDMQEFRKRMTTLEEVNRMLKHDRDVLIDYSRLLIGQATQAGLKVDYPMPALQSIIAVPGPSLTVPGPPLPPPTPKP